MQSSSLIQSLERMHKKAIISIIQDKQAYLKGETKLRKKPI